MIEKGAVGIYKDDKGDDLMLLSLLQSPPGHALPARIEAEFDPLGLIRHENIHGAAAEQVYGAFSHVAERLATNDKDIRDSLVSGDCVELPKCRIDRFNVFGLRRIHYPETGRVAYELYRDDIGNPDGGFFVTRNADGAVILSRHELNGRKPEGENSPEYADLIHQATLAAIVYAKKVGIPLNGLADKTDEEHLSDERIAEFEHEYKRENSRTHKLLQGIGRVANSPIVLVNRLFTVPDPEEVKLGMENPRRLPSKKRIISALALTALLTPIPGYSPNLHTPASVVAAIDIKDYLASGDNNTVDAPPAPDPVAQYDSRHINLSQEFDLEVGTTKPVTLISGDLPRSVLTAPVIETGEFGADSQLIADSPRKVSVIENMGPNQCVRLPIAESVQGETYSLGTLDPSAAESITVETGITALTLCNNSEDVISSDVLGGFIFDVRK